MLGNGSFLCAFRLMPLESHVTEPIEAAWSFEVIDMDRRLVAFTDESRGDITSWTWEFGDGTVSHERNPIHRYSEQGLYNVVVLTVEGPAGTSRMAKVWDVAVK